MTKFTPLQIASMKREVRKLSKSTGKPNWQCLDEIAQAEGYSDWPMLMIANRVKTKGSVTAPNPPQDRARKIKTALLEYVQQLKSSSVSSLCKINGSIWVDKEDVIQDNVGVYSFHALGPASDVITQEYGDRLAAMCILDLKGITGCFVYAPEDEDEQDEEDIALQLREGFIVHSEENYLKVLIETIEYFFDSDWDRMNENIDELIFQRTE